jgi:ABC-type phosphate/phosphonate transport system substrate-binding protein
MSESTILVGAVAYDPKAVTIWETIRHLFREVPPGLDYVLYSSYEALVDALFRGVVEVAWNTPVAWVRCLRRSAGKALPLAMRDTDVGFTAKLVTGNHSGVKTLADLAGKSVAFGSRDSCQAAILPQHFLLTLASLREGEDYEAIRFDLDVGKHGDTGTSELEVLRCVQSGDANAGAVGDAVWAQSISTGAIDTGKVKAFWTSPPFSHCNFTALPSLEEKRAKAFVDGLLAMDYADPEVRRMMDLEGLKKWVPGRHSGYDELERAMEEQGLL